MQFIIKSNIHVAKLRFADQKLFKSQRIQAASFSNWNFAAGWVASHMRQPKLSLKEIAFIVYEKWNDFFDDIPPKINRCPHNPQPLNFKLMFFKKWWSFPRKKLQTMTMGTWINNCTALISFKKLFSNISQRKLYRYCNLHNEVSHEMHIDSVHANRGYFSCFEWTLSQLLHHRSGSFKNYFCIEIVADWKSSGVRL